MRHIAKGQGHLFEGAANFKQTIDVAQSVTAAAGDIKSLVAQTMTAAAASLGSGAGAMSFGGGGRPSIGSDPIALLSDITGGSNTSLSVTLTGDISGTGSVLLDLREDVLSISIPTTSTLSLAWPNITDIPASVNSLATLSSSGVVVSTGGLLGTRGIGTANSTDILDRASADLRYAIASGSVVTSFNTRIGDITLTNTDVTDALTFNPLDSAIYTASDVLTKLKTVDGTGSGLDADLLDGQHGAFYLDLTNSTGTLATTGLSGTYSINITGNATSATTANNASFLNGQAGNYYTNLANSTGTLPTARLTGTYSINITGNAATATTAGSATSATTATTATNATNANNASFFNGSASNYYTDIPGRLGFTPIQQGTGAGQTGSTVKIGWSGSRLKAEVGTTDIGNIVFDAQLASASVANATNLNGQAASYYTNYNNLINKPTSFPTGPLDASIITSGRFDVDRIPVLPSQKQFTSSGDLTDLTPTQQTEIGQGSIITVQDGSRYVYTGTGSKTDVNSYIILADITPDWTTISGKPSSYPPNTHTHTFASLTSKPTTLAGYGITDAASTVDLSGKANIVSPIFTGNPQVSDGGTLAILESDATRRNQIIIGANASGGYINSTYADGGTGDLRFMWGNSVKAIIKSTGFEFVDRPSVAGNLLNDAPLHSSRDFPLGTLVTTDITYPIASSIPFVMEITGNSYGSGVPFDTKIQGYLYNNTVYSLGGVSNGIHIPGMVALSVAGKLCFWWPTMSYWQGFNIKLYNANTGVRAIANLVTSITNAAKPAGTAEVDVSAVTKISWNSGNFDPAAKASIGSFPTFSQVRTHYGANSGSIYFGSGMTTYLDFDGTNYNLNAPGGGLWVNGNAVWSTGNFNPATKLNVTGGAVGGTIIGAVNEGQQLVINGGTSNSAYMAFYAVSGGARSGYVGYGAPGTAGFYLSNERSGGDINLNTTGGGLPKFNGNTLWHAGNMPAPSEFPTGAPSTPTIGPKGVLYGKAFADYGNNLGITFANRVVMPGGGAMVTTTQTVTGALKIKLPLLRTGAMIKFRVEIFNYITGNTQTFVISGYPYNNSGTTNWINMSCEQYTESGAQMNVRFGYDGTTDCVWIGETNTAWSYPQVFIMEMSYGYGALNDKRMLTDWVLGWVTAFDTVTATRAAAKVWNTANMGPSSGLNADLLDGYHADTSSQSAWTIPVRDSIGFLNQRVIGNRSGSTSDGMYIGYDNAGGSSSYTRIYGGGSTENGLFVGASNAWWSTSSAAYPLWYSGNIPVNSWQTSSDGQQRFRFDASSHTYIKTGDAFVFRNVADDNAFYVSGAGAMSVTTSVTAPSVVATSDVSLKRDIKDLLNPMDLINSLRPVRYHRTDTNRDSIGFIAQEFEKTIPELVVDGQDGLLGIEYGQITAILTGALKEAMAKITELETRLSRLEK